MTRRWMRWGAVLVAVGMIGGGGPSQSPPEGRPLLVMDAGGASARPLGPHPEYTVQGSPDWSGDGTHLAVEAWRPHLGETGGQAHILVIDVRDGTTHDLGPGAMPSFSPKGERIAYSMYSPQGGVWVMNRDGSDPMLLDAGGWGAVWSPDGRQIAYTVYRGLPNIVVYDVIEGTRRRLFEDGGTHFQQLGPRLCWSPDSRWICFQGTTRSGEHQTALISAAGSDDGLRRRLTDDRPPDAAESGLAWSPDGRRILCVRRDPQTQRPQICWFDPQTDAPPRRLDGQPADRVNTDPAWSPDGKRIVFASAAEE